MKDLFNSSTINGLSVANRFIRSATWLGLATEKGYCTPELINRMVELSLGQVGLIITGHAYVLPEGQASIRQLGIYRDDMVVGLKDMTSRVHDNGGRIVLQLSHAGFFAKKALTGKTPLAVSAVEGIARAPREEMTVEDIKKIIDAFGLAAARAKEAGFDGVQIHAAHGYLLSQFLSPLFNKRTDSYGGTTIEDRVRAPLEVLHAIRKNVGRDYPVLIKMNCQDYASNGLTLEESIKAACILEKNGLDAIEISGGLLTSIRSGPNRPGINSVEKEAYFQKEAVEFRKNVSVPLILVGGIRSYDVVQRLFDRGVADYFSMSRPFINEPMLVKRWKEGDRRKSECISDNRCFVSGRSGEGVSCVRSKKE